MDLNLSKWLREDLNVNIFESHLNPLLYHPRHGTLMRKLLMFLVKSTLSNEKHSTVLVREESSEIRKTLEDLNTKILEAWLELDEIAEKEEIHEIELCQLESRLQDLERTIQSQKASFMDLESKVSESNQAIERVVENITNPSYLRTNSAPQPETDLPAHRMTAHQKTVVNELFCNNLKKIVTLQQLALRTIHLIEVEKDKSNKN